MHAIAPHLHPSARAAICDLNQEMISTSKNFLFIHYPKTGGNSIQAALANWSEDKLICTAPHHDGYQRFEVKSKYDALNKHATLRMYETALPSATFQSLFKIITTRNPWDRAISYYFSPHRGCREFNENAFIKLIDSIKPMEHFLSCEKLTDGLAQIDQVLRFWRLEDDFSSLCKRLSLPPINLDKRNSSEKKLFTKYYTDKTKIQVFDRFRQEIEYFGYSFE